MQELGERGSYITMEKSGNNALDFHIAYYLGTLAASDPTALFHIISRDTGFDPLIQHLKEKKIYAARSSAIAEMPCFQTPKDCPPVETLALQPSVGGTAQKLYRASLRLSAKDLLQRAITDLQKRQQSRPRTMKTLTSTLHAVCGKELPEGTIMTVVNSLVQKRYVIVQGTKISYSLPENGAVKSSSAN